MNTVVCINCLADDYLRIQLADNDVGECNFCNEEHPVIDLSDLVERCDQAIHSSFSEVSQPDAVIHFGLDPVGLPVGEVLARLLPNADSVLLDDVAAELLNQWVERDDGDPYFQESVDSPAQLHSDWNRMEQSLRYEARLVNPNGVEVLESVFTDLDRLDTGYGESSAIITAGPGTPFSTFIRARAFETESELVKALEHPEKCLGPTPPGTGSAGRMNAKGVSMFYGAADTTTAIAEVRPPVGSQVVTAAFEVIREVRLLNLSYLSTVLPSSALSYFDPIRSAQAQHCSFLKELQEKMQVPVMPATADQEYLITQAIADFLATHTDLNLDGILFKSVQVKDGMNVVLFHKASSVERADEDGAPAHANLWDSDDHQWRFAPELHEADPSSKGERMSWRAPHFGREQTLRLNRDAIKIHNINAVFFCDDAHPVRYVPWGEVYQSGRR